MDWTPVGLQNGCQKQSGADDMHRKDRMDALWAKRFKLKAPGLGRFYQIFIYFEKGKFRGICMALFIRANFVSENSNL